MIIRRVKQKDVPEIVKLVRKTFKQFIFPFKTKKAAEYYLSKIEEKAKELPTKERIAFVAVEKKKIVGVVDGAFRKDGGYTRWLYVDKKCHRQGIGKLLMKKIENAFKKKVKVAKLYSSNYAVKFYERIGYKKSRGLVKKKGGYSQPMKKILRR